MLNFVHFKYKIRFQIIFFLRYECQCEQTLPVFWDTLYFVCKANAKKKKYVSHDASFTSPVKSPSWCKTVSLECLEISLRSFEVMVTRINLNFCRMKNQIFICWIGFSFSWLTLMTEVQIYMLRYCLLMAFGGRLRLSL